MPKSGKEVSALGLGCMRLPMEGKDLDEEKAIELIRYAVDAGITYLDTAWTYHDGKSEEILGKALTKGYRERVTIATKLPQWQVRNRADMEMYLNAQLKKLRTDVIDYYLVHKISSGSGWDRLVEKGIIPFLNDAKKDGRIQYAGFSFHAGTEDFRRIVDAYDWDVCLIQYNYLDETSQAGTAGLEYAASKGLGVLVMEPLRGGKLAGEQPEDVQAIWDSAAVKRTPAAWGLSWVWNHPEVTVVLSGMSDIRQIEENCKTADETLPNSLSAEELELVSRVRDIYRSRLKTGCTGCRYCMPCPFGVDIPGCMEIYDNYGLFGNKKSAQFWYFDRMGGATGGVPTLASQCRQCGKCLKACPQHLPIPDLMKEVQNEFEGLKFSVMRHLGKPLLALYSRIESFKNRKHR